MTAKENVGGGVHCTPCAVAMHAQHTRPPSAGTQQLTIKSSTVTTVSLKQATQVEPSTDATPRVATTPWADHMRTPL